MKNESRPVSVVGLVAGLVLIPMLLGQSSADKERAAGSECPTGYLCGQNLDRNNVYYYSDLGLCNPDDPNQCGGITAEDFPPPGGWAFGAAIGEITFYGTYNGVNGNMKDHQFTITFYPFNSADPNRPLLSSPACSYPALVPYRVTQVYTVEWQGGGTSPGLEFAVKLPTACTLGHGHFSIASSNIVPGIYWLWAPSSATEGNARTSRWWANSPSSWTPLSESNQDRQYCFTHGDFGVCCYDVLAWVDCASTEAACLAAGGRFAIDCGHLIPACGSVLGACCKDNGTCTIATYATCVGSGACCVGTTCTVYSEAACVFRNGTYYGTGTTCSPNPCVLTVCRGDCNCDGGISYADINPFVKALSNLSAWQVQYPICPWQNLDVNGDGVASYADINSFVARLATPGPCGTRFAEPDRSRGAQWLGPNTLCSSCSPTAADFRAPPAGEPLH
jgi:hypothetical protein